MKTMKTLILLAGLSAAISGLAQSNSTPGAAATTVVTNITTSPPAIVPPESGPPPGSPATPSIPQPVENTNSPTSVQTTNVVSPGDLPAPDQVVESPASAPPLGTNGLMLNFRGASLDQVLNYLSEAAGFIIVLDAQPRGRVDVFSGTPVSKDEAVNLLNQALKKNGYAAIRNGRILTIVPRDEAKIRDVPVHMSADPDKIPKTDDIVTQIIPVRFVEAAQLLKDIQPLVSTQTTMTADESGNEIVITDTQANIHKVAEIVKAIDEAAEDVTVVRVFKLNYADPNEMADLLGNLFPDDSKSGGSSSPVQFGGPGSFRNFFRGGGFGGFGGQGGQGGNTGGGANGQNQRIKKRARVIAVADPRTSSLVVSAAQDLMDQISGVITELDGNAARKKVVRVIKLNNADPNEVLPVLQDIFEKNGGATSRSSSQSSLQQRQQSQQTSGSSSSSSSSGSRGSSSGGSSFGR